MAENSSGDQSHWWYSKEYGPFAPGLEITTTNSPASLAIYKDGVWYLDLNGNGAWDGTPTDGLYYFGGGLTGAVPVTGDWTGTGDHEDRRVSQRSLVSRSERQWSLGWHADRRSLLLWRRSDRSSTRDRRLDGNGRPRRSACMHNGVWYLDLNGNGAWDGTPTDGLYYFGGGLTGAVPVTGDWTGTGTTKIGVYHNGVWYLDLNGNGAWDGTPTDGLYYFGGGLTGAVPVTGDWTGTGVTRIGVYAQRSLVSRSERQRSMGWHADRWSLLLRRRSDRGRAGCRQMKIG